MQIERIFLIFTIIKVSIAEINGPIVELPTGKIRGRQTVTSTNNNLYVFLKIPFAAPPIGELRFQAPQPHQGWDDILDATEIDITCFQTSLTPTTPAETEDCLVLNVFTPELPSEDKNVSLPVMFFIFGGGFDRGSSDFYVSDRFADNGVILVTINYRVGPLGFLSTGDDVIPGNNGLKDQQFALKWVSNSIHLFGGDSNKITIFGQSAGSASVGYQLLNQANSGLFVGAILESGSFLCPWAFQRHARDIAFATAALINSTFETNRNSQDLLEFLLSVDAKAIDAASEQFKNSTVNDISKIEIITGFQWAPVIEAKNPTAFITKKMYKLLEAANIVQVPVLIGITSEEGLSSNQNPSLLSERLMEYDANLTLLVPEDMVITDVNVTETQIELGEQVRNMYTDNVLAGNPAAGVKFNSDTSFNRPIIRHASLYSKLAKTYFYEFSYYGSLPVRQLLYSGAGNVTHADELNYIFCIQTTHNVIKPCNITWAPIEDQITSQRLMKLWTNFAKYQDPTPELSELLQNITWPEVASEDGDFIYLDIGENLEVKSNPKEDTYNKWIDLYDALDYNDFDTY